jgi:Asp-tRNA(Asn)/Glu-tRNA(Gln) amidotransferase A subunit family amidase
MTEKNPADLTATEAAHLIHEGALKSQALVEACIGRIREREDDVRAWQYFDPDVALEQARHADERFANGEHLGLLHGLPVGIKDIIATADMPTEDGTPANKGRQPDADAACVRALREAGAVIMGKTVTTELATRFPGKTRNPHNLEHTPGGSSSGSAAAVACGMVPLALGTQTGGSVTRPASFCGIYGLKPTLGMISRQGVTMQSHTLDTVGVYGRSTQDLALIGDALSIPDPSDPVSYSRAIGGLAATVADRREKPAPRFAFVRTPAWDKADSAAQKSIIDFVARHSHAITEAPDPVIFETIIDAHRCVQHAENAHHFADIEARARDLLSPTLREILDLGRTIPAKDYLDALALRDMAYRELTALLDRYDALVCLSACGAPPRGLESTGNPIFNGMWTLLGVPTVTLPLLTADGLPLGIQIIGKRREEHRLLRNAAWLDRAARV